MKKGTEKNVVDLLLYLFAGNSIHISAGFEFISQHRPEISEVLVKWQGNSTYFPNLMNQNYQAYLLTIPKDIKQISTKMGENFRVENSFKNNKNEINIYLEEFIRVLSNIDTIDELQSIKVFRIEPGPALVNTLINLSPTSSMDFINKKSLIIKLFKSYVQVYLTVQSDIRKYSPQEILVYNGRFLHERATIDAAISMKTDYVLYETIRDRFVHDKLSFHDSNVIQQKQIGHWSKSLKSNSDKLIIASKYFDGLRSKENPFYADFPTNLEFRSLNHKNYFVYFSNSDEEMLGFWKELSHPLGSQISVVLNLVKIFNERKSDILVIRLHPNLANKPIEIIKPWLEIPQSEFVLVVLPENKVSSYSLLDGSKGVISFGSTIGLEAAYWKKPSLLLGSSGYDNLGATENARSWHEVLKWFSNINKFTQEYLNERSEKACIRGFYIETAGDHFRDATLINLGRGAWEVTKYKGILLNRNFLIKLASKIILKFRIKKFVSESRR